MTTMLPMQMMAGPGSVQAEMIPKPACSPVPAPAPCLTLARVIEELQTMRQVLPADAPVRAWLLSPGAGVPPMAVLEICGVTGGVDRRTGRLCTTLQLRLPHEERAAATGMAGSGAGSAGHGLDADGSCDGHAGLTLTPPAVNESCRGEAEAAPQPAAVGGMLAGAAAVQTEPQRPEMYAVAEAGGPGETSAEAAAPEAHQHPACHEAYPGPHEGNAVACPWW